MYQDPWPPIESTADERFANRWGAVRESVAEDGNGDRLYEVRDLVECFNHPKLFNADQVQHLQHLLDNKQESSPAPAISRSDEHGRGAALLDRG